MAGPVREFLKTNFRHFNAATIVAAAESYEQLIKSGGKMFMSIAGAMSTAELGLTLSDVIRRGYVHAISCTGANLEEDLFNLLAHKEYRRIPEYRDLTPKDEETLWNDGWRRVTDTCIPEDQAMNRLGETLLEAWQAAEKKGEKYLPYEYLYQIIRSGRLKDKYQIDPKHSWVLAACEMNIPIYSPGWEDSTTGNYFVGCFRNGTIKNLDTVKAGVYFMDHLVDWYRENGKKADIGFFQIAGGIAGDFAICAVPLIRIDLGEECKSWSYFCQISDSTTSYGSYSGAVPNEKITWGKLDVETPKFMIESDASIVAPLIFAYLLNQ